MVKRTRIRVGFMVAVLLLAPLTGCTGDERPDSENTDKAVESGAAVVGSFVGEVSGTKAFVAVVAAPPEDEKASGTVQIFMSDGRGLSEWFAGPVSGGGFVLQSEDGDAETKGTLSGDSVTGTVSLPGDTTGRYEARPPSGAAGIYELTVSAGGELSGASAAGLAVTGQLSLGNRGTGRLRLVDGRRLELALTRNRADDLAHLRAGQVRLIVLSDGELRGEVKGRPANGGALEFFIRSA